MLTPPSSDLRQRRDVGELINFTFDFLRENLRPLGRCIVRICGPAIVIASVLLGYMYYSDESGTTIGLWGFVYGLFFLGWKSVVTAIALLLLVTILLSTVISAYVILRERGDNDVTVDAVWRMTSANYGRATFSVVVVALFTALGAATFIIPGIYLAITFSMIVTAQIAEDLSLGDAISRCTRLIKENWWSTAGLLFVIGIVAMFLSYGPMFSYYIITLLAEFVELSPPVFNVLRMVVQVLAMAFQLLLLALGILASALNYFNLVEGRDGVGLLAKIEQIGALVDEDMPARSV
jgi:hypothetical protein